MLHNCSKIPPQTRSTEMSMNESEAHPAQRAAGTCRCKNTATSTTTNCTCDPCNCTTGTSTTICTATGGISVIVWTMGKPLRHNGEVNVIEEELQMRNLVRNCVQNTTVFCTVWTMSALNGHDEPKLHLWNIHGLSRQTALSGPRHL